MLGKALGQGVSSNVHICHRISDGAQSFPLSVKVCKTNESNIKRIKEEYEVLRGLKHQNIIKIHEPIYENDYNHTIHQVMDYIDGFEMFEPDRDNVVYDRSKIQSFMIQLLRGLEYLNK